MKKVLLIALIFLGAIFAQKPALRKSKRLKASKEKKTQKKMWSSPRRAAAARLPYIRRMMRNGAVPLLQLENFQDDDFPNGYLTKRCASKKDAANRSGKIAELRQFIAEHSQFDQIAVPDHRYDELGPWIYVERVVPSDELLSLERVKQLMALARHKGYVDFRSGNIFNTSKAVYIIDCGLESFRVCGRTRYKGAYRNASPYYLALLNMQTLSMTDQARSYLDRKINRTGLDGQPTADRRESLDSFVGRSLRI